MGTGKSLLYGYSVCSPLVRDESLSGYSGKLAEMLHVRRGQIGKKKKKRQDITRNGKLPNRPIIPLQTLENLSTSS